MAPAPPTDAELLAAWAAGDGSAGEQLFERHYPAIYRFFVNKLSRPSEVEDLVQQSFMACIESRAAYRGDASFRSYLFGIARNILLKYLRNVRTHSVEPGSSSLADCGLGVSSLVHLRREQQVLLTALRAIPIDSQAVLEMSYWEQMPAREIAAVLNETEPAIRGRLRRAKAELRGAIEAVVRDPSELASTLDGLEDWAASLRAYWQVSA